MTEVLETALDKKKKYIGCTKGAIEAVIFIFFSNKEWLELFDHSPLHFVFLPALAVAMTAEAYLEVAAYRAKKEKGMRDLAHVVMAVAIAVIIDFAVGAPIVAAALGIAFTLTPFLFLGALGLMALRTADHLRYQVQAYRSASRSTKPTHAQEIALNVVRLVATSVMIVFVVGAMLTPFGPAAVLALGIVAAVLALSLASWKIMPSSYRQGIKKRGPRFFDKVKYHANDDSTDEEGYIVFSR